MTYLDRRSFLAATTAATVPLLGRGRPTSGNDGGGGGGGGGGPVAISSANGLDAVRRAMDEMRRGQRPVAAVVEGVTLVEDDPDDMSVGYGGLPNEEGVVQLDASVMDGPMHKAGAVAALERVRNAARVALDVLRRTDHVLLVGDGARRFATSLGYPEQDLLTEKSRSAWLRWKRNLNDRDDWLDDDQMIETTGKTADAGGATPWTHGTIRCAAVDANGDLGACTTTSGLSYKVPGRVGDSPIIGAGMFVDNEVGAAGATGRGESVIQSCGAFQIVSHMARGDDPAEACLRVLRWIARHTRRPMLLNARGEPGFGVTLYALRKDGVYGGASMHKGAQMAVHDGTEARKVACSWLYD